MVRKVSSSVPEPDGGDELPPPAGGGLDRSQRILKIPINGDTHTTLQEISRARGTTVAALIRGLISPLVQAWRAARGARP